MSNNESLIPKLWKTPNSSPSRSSSQSKRASGSPTSPSRIPILPSYKQRNNGGNMAVHRNRHKNTSVDDHLSLIQSHLSTEVAAERASIAMANKQIDQQLDLKRKHERHLKLLQRELNNVNARLQEYQLGIPIKESELKSETVNVENQIDELESQYELKKMEITKKFIHDEERFVKDLDALVEDAQTEDSQARDMKLAKLELLNEEKKSLMEKIGLAKGAFAEELQSLKEKYKDEEDKQRAKLGNLKETVLSERKKLQKQYDSLKREYDDLKEKDISTDGEILRCKSNIEATEKSIQELKYRLLDLRTLIDHLQSDLETASSLCTEFENGEFQSTKREWEEANDCLQLERYKRLKLEIQIRNLSGIPSILIMESKLNQSFKQSKLREFLKPDNYDWKLEVLTNMENSLNGISQSLIICNESDTKLAELAQQVQSHLQKTVANNDRFKTSQVSIEIPLLSELRKTYPQIPDIPTSYAAILLDNHNPITGASRCSLIFMVHISKSIQLPELPLFTITQTNLCATNVTDSWEPELIRITSIPPVTSRKAYEFLN